MNSQQIEYILAVEECRSFSKAAKKLFVTQPSLSQYIINTEQKLGFALFDRSRTPVGLTPEGEIFVAYAKQIRALENELGERLAELSERRNGKLSVACELDRLPLPAERAFEEYTATVGEASVSCDAADPQKLISRLKEGSLDAAVTFAHPHDDSLETVPVSVWLSVRRQEDRSYPDERFFELVRKNLDETGE